MQASPTGSPFQETTMKNDPRSYSAPRPHWVGDGFHVRSLFTYDTHVPAFEPVLMLDYAAPRSFRLPRPRGVGVHPHRGFETVTIVYRARSSIAIPPQRRAHRPGSTSSG
jgi:redox-sensitive bicupin YhaK (pirin superfamily)